MLGKSKNRKLMPTFLFVFVTFVLKRNAKFFTYKNKIFDCILKARNVKNLVLCHIIQILIKYGIVHMNFLKIFLFIYLFFCFVADLHLAAGWTNPKSQVFFTEEENIQAKELEVAAAQTMAADSSILPSLTQTHPVPKLEDFFADSSSLVHSQTETQDSSLTHIYDHHHHGSAYFNDHQQDLKAIAGFQAFSTNSGSEVDDSTSMTRTQLPAAEFAGHSIESTGNELGFSNSCPTTGCLSLGVNNNATNNANSNNNVNKNQGCNEKKAIVSADSDCTKKVADTFGQRTSIYRGVTR